MPSSDRTLIDIQAEVDKDTQDFFPELDSDLGYLALAMAGEAGEFANMVKKIIRGTMDVNQKEVRIDMAFELVDVLIYIAMLANLLDIDLAETYGYKRDINVTRFGTKNPDGNSSGSGSGVVREMPTTPGDGS